MCSWSRGAKEIGKKNRFFEAVTHNNVSHCTVVLESHEVRWVAELMRGRIGIVHVPEAFRPGRPNAASAPQGQEAARGTNRNWVSYFYILAGPVVGC